MENALTIFFGFIVLSLLVVVCGGVVPARYQNWGSVLTGAIAIPAAILMLVGLGGLFIG